MKKYLSLFTLFLLAAPSLFAAEVTRTEAKGTIVWLGKAKVMDWKLNESICLFQPEGLVGCGTVAALTEESLGIRLKEKKKDLVAGERVSLSRSNRSLAATSSVSDDIENNPKRPLVDLGLGMSAGFHYYYPMLHAQIAVTRDFSLGIMPVYASYSQADNSVNFYGGYLTATYYYTHYAFKGFNFEGGVGFFHIGASTTGVPEQSVNPLAVKFTVGWRGRALWGLPIDLGAAVGAQYVAVSTTPLDISYKGFLPLLSVFIAYNF